MVGTRTVGGMPLEADLSSTIGEDAAPESTRPHKVDISNTIKEDAAPREHQGMPLEADLSSTIGEDAALESTRWFRLSTKAAARAATWAVVPSQLKGRSMNSHLVSQCLPPSMLAVYHTLLDFKHLVVPEEEIATIARHAELVGGDMSSGSGSSPISSSGADEEESAHAYERDRQRKSRFKTVLRGSQEARRIFQDPRLRPPGQPPNSSPEKSRPLLPSIPAIQAIQASYSTSALHPTGDVHDASIPHTVASPRDSPLLTSPRAVTNPLLGSSAGASSAQRQLLQSMSYPNLPSGASSRSASQSAGWTEVAAAAGGDERVAAALGTSLAASQSAGWVEVAAAAGGDARVTAALGTSLAALQLRGGEAASSSFPSAPRGVPPLPGRPPLSSSENSVSSSASQPMQGSDAGAGAGNKSGSKNGSGSGAASMAGYGLEWGAARDCRSSTLSGTKSVDMSGISLSAAAQAAQYAAAAAQTRFNSANSSSAAPSSAADTIPRSDAELTKGMERSNPMSGLMPEGANHYSMDLDSRHSASGSGGGGRGSSASGAAKTGGSSAPARKLKLELLHEDDMARMGSLIKHLTSCRPPRRVPSSKASAPRAASTNPASSKPAASGSAHSSSSSRSSRPATAQDKENKGVYASPVAGHQEYGLSSSLPGGAAMQARSMSAQHSGSISNSRAGVYRERKSSGADEAFFDGGAFDSNFSAIHSRTIPEALIEIAPGVLQAQPTPEDPLFIRARQELFKASHMQLIGVLEKVQSAIDAADATATAGSGGGGSSNPGYFPSPGTAAGAAGGSNTIFYHSPETIPPGGAGACTAAAAPTGGGNTIFYRLPEPISPGGGDSGGAAAAAAAPPPGPSPSSIASIAGETTHSDTSSGSDTPGANGPVDPDMDPKKAHIMFCTSSEVVLELMEGSTLSIRKGSRRECGKIMAAWSNLSKSHPWYRIGTASSLLAALSQLPETGPTDASLSDLLQQSQAFLLEKEKEGALGQGGLGTNGELPQARANILLGVRTQNPNMIRNYPPAEATHQQVCADSELFLLTLGKLLTEMGVRIKMRSKVGGKEVDLHRLYKEVTTLGGLDHVINNKQWATVCAPFNFPAPVTSRSFLIKKLYCKALNHYEQVYFHRNTGPVLTPPSQASLSVRRDLDLLSIETATIPVDQMRRSYQSSKPGSTWGFCVGGHSADQEVGGLGHRQEVGGQGQGHGQEDGGLGHSQGVEVEVVDGEGEVDPHPLCKVITTLGPQGHPNPPLGPKVHSDPPAIQISDLRPGTRFCGTIDSSDGNGYTLFLELSSGQPIQGVRFMPCKPYQ
eukprot:gene14277-20251_t